MVDLACKPERQYAPSYRTTFHRSDLGALTQGYISSVRSFKHRQCKTCLRGSWSACRSPPRLGRPPRVARQLRPVASCAPRHLEPLAGRGLRDGERLPTAEVQGHRSGPPSEPIQVVSDCLANLQGTVQVRRYEREPLCPPLRPPDSPLDRSRPLSSRLRTRFSRRAALLVGYGLLYLLRLSQLSRTIVIRRTARHI